MRNRHPVLVLDLETIVDATLPPPPRKENGDEAFPPIPHHQIVVLGAAFLDASYRLRSLWAAGEGKGEVEALSALVGFLNDQLTKGRRITIVGFNSRGFDLPVIVARCLRHGLAFPWYYASEARRRYGGSGHVDLMDLLSDHGAARAYSLDLAAKLIGMPGKMDAKGSDVAKMIATGQLEQVLSYCLSDVAQTVALFLRTQLLRGELTQAEYIEGVEALLHGIAREPRLAPMLPKIDHSRLLLQASEANAAMGAAS